MNRRAAGGAAPAPDWLHPHPVAGSGVPLAASPDWFPAFPVGMYRRPRGAPKRCVARTSL
ncbi:hypothetical protein CBM2587_A230197 [Cupriavidus taiwanensis]|uniref:Uncharacterized protein n=1 Tax=Cupriavidus taiwanensis TaxID=164546 RepID=A0A375BRV6_9BURK|nr:hypothetical protein CBM2587_A230197 [Cupriavidus taiwanensis]